jgi:transposase
MLHKLIKHEITGGMKAVRIRELTTEEKKELENGLRSSEAYTVRRCQILLSNEQGQTAPKIAEGLHCSAQSVRRAIHAFKREGIKCIQKKSSRPHNSVFSFDDAALKRLPDIANSSPRDYGIEHSLWSLKRLVKVCHQLGMVEKQIISASVMREAIKRAGIDWKRIRKRIRSTDEAYEAKKSSETN